MAEDWGAEEKPANRMMISFLPTAQCGGTTPDEANSFPKEGEHLSNDVVLTLLALGGNEPNQDGYC